MLNLYELALVIKEPLRIETAENGFRIEFLNCEVKDYKGSSIIGTAWGSGRTVDIAADNYFKRINGKWLVFDSLKGGNRREYAAEIAEGKEKQDA